jgi:lactose/cellobiose-specific phosphotransferase system IIC component
MPAKIRQLFNKIENMKVFLSIRNGFVSVIPIIMAGVVTLVLMSLPLPAYQSFLQVGLGAKLYSLFNVVYMATFCKLAVYLTLSISMHYIKNTHNKDLPLAAPITSLICFFILNNFNLSNEYLGVKGVFMSIVVSLISSQMLVYIFKLVKSKRKNCFDSGDLMFNRSVALIIPVFVTVLIFSIVNVIVVGTFGVDSFMDLIDSFANAVFMNMGRSFASALLLVICVDLMWCFGIHGSNVLETAIEKIFDPAILENRLALAQGKIPTEIFTKQFFDVFVLIGGCGATISLLIAILCFGKGKSMRRVSWFSLVPMLFNVNELMIFGLPVIFNITLLIPFVIVPILLFLISFAATVTGIVPVTINNVSWTTPVIISGYLATNSLRGSLLQIFNIVVGVAVYKPFVRAYDRCLEENSLKLYNNLVDVLKHSEESVTPVVLTELEGRLGVTARDISSDLRYALANKELMLYYQPQYDNNREYTGAEALLRWKHPLYGMIYPPLIIQLAMENDFLADLEEYVVLTAIAGGKHIYKETGVKKEIGINVSAATIRSERFYDLAKKLIDEGIINKGDVCIEITEQIALISNNAYDILDRLKDIKQLGYSLAIDDFSMGHTSLKYLQDNQFDVVKLDGAIVKSMQMSENNFDIVKSIMGLSDALGFDVIAEYVENESQMKLLYKIGCCRYQGWLFSPAISCDELIDRLKDGK